MVDYKLLCGYKILIMILYGYVSVRVKQSLPVNPLTHKQMSGAVHCLLVPHGGLQIAMWL